ncbi:MAG TPA: hypothetical protein VGK32_02400 [Vicinamibacterales bacterium]
MAVVIRLVVMAALAAAIVSPGPVGPSDQPIALGPVDQAFQRLYNFDFTASLSILDTAAQADPQNPLLPSVRAGTYLFMELDRLKILEARFFMNNSNMVDGASRLVPDPVVRTRLFAALANARTLAKARLAGSPDDGDALLALCMSAGVETDYTALVDRRTWRSIKLAPAALEPARRLLARTPPAYDAYLNFGALEYIVGDLPFFIRWLVHYDGIEGNKRRGIEELKLAARHGRYYGPFARVLLVVVSLREKKIADAEQLLTGLVQEFPENPLFRKELTIVTERLRRTASR